MSGIKALNLTLFHRKLRARGSSVSAIAKEIFCGRSHVTQVINGTRSGRHTWPKLERVLRPDELALLGRNVPRGTLSHMEHLEAVR
jgi:hypothetical protein